MYPKFRHHATYPVSLYVNFERISLDVCISHSRSYQPSTPPGSCTALTSTCNPTCQNGGTCVAGTPTATCQCVTGYMGLDCSIRRATFPTPCNLVHLWPMTTTHLNNLGKLTDVVNSTGDLSVNSGIYFLDNGPYSEPNGLNWGIPELRPTSPVGAIKATLPVVPFQLNAPFTISAFVRISPTGNWYTFYPLFSFTDDGIAGNSPLIRVNAIGQMLFTYTSFDLSFTDVLDPPSNWIGVGLSWKFVSFRYDHITTKINYWLDGSQAEQVLNGTFKYPVYKAKTLYIGSSDLSATVFDGSVSCVSIYNWRLTDAEVAQLKLACREVLGGAAAPTTSSTCHACTGASLPYGYMGIPDANDYMFPAGSVVEYNTVANTWFDFPYPVKYATTTCSSVTGLWDPTPLELTVGALICDPECGNK